MSELAGRLWRPTYPTYRTYTLKISGNSAPLGPPYKVGDIVRFDMHAGGRLTNQVVVAVEPAKYGQGYEVVLHDVDAPCTGPGCTQPALPNVEQMCQAHLDATAEVARRLEERKREFRVALSTMGLEVVQAVLTLHSELPDGTCAGCEEREWGDDDFDPIRVVWFKCRTIRAIAGVAGLRVPEA